MSALFIAKILQHFFKNIEVNKETLDKSLNTPQFRMKASFNIDIRRRYKWGRMSGWIYKIRYNDPSTFADNQEFIAGESFILLKTIPALFPISL